MSPPPDLFSNRTPYALVTSTGVYAKRIFLTS